MAKDRRKLQHIHSSIPDKQPTPQSLEVGEIAVNNAANQEFLSIKNSDDVVKRFSSDEQIITWMERKEVMPYEGYTRGADGPAGSTGPDSVKRSDLLDNTSNIIIKLNQVAASNTVKHDKVNGAKDIYGKCVNPTSDSGVTDGAGFAIDMSRYAMMDANPSFSALTVTDQTNLQGNTFIENGTGTGKYANTNTGHTLTITTTDVVDTNTNWTETITNKQSTVTNETDKITTLNESATTRNTTVGTETLHVSGTTTETHDKDVTITNNSGVTETTKGNVVENVSGTTTINHNGTTTINESGDTIVNTTGSTTIQSTGAGSDVTIYAKDDLCATSDDVAAFRGVNKTNVGIDCSDTSRTKVTNVYGDTINVRGNTADTRVTSAYTSATTATTVIGTANTSATTADYSGNTLNSHVKAVTHSGDTLNITESTSTTLKSPATTVSGTTLTVDEGTSISAKTPTTYLSGTTLDVKETNTDITSCGRISANTNDFEVKQCAANGKAIINSDDVDISGKTFDVVETTSATIKAPATTISGTSLTLDEGTSISAKTPSTTISGTNFTLNETNTTINSCGKVEITTDSYSLKQCNNGGTADFEFCGGFNVRSNAVKFEQCDTAGTFTVIEKGTSISGETLTIRESGATDFSGNTLTTTTAGNTNINVKGNLTEKVTGTTNETHTGDVTITNSNNKTENTTGAHSIYSTGNTCINSQASANFYGKGSTNIGVACDGSTKGSATTVYGTTTTISANTLNETSAGNTNINVGGNLTENVTGTTTITRTGAVTENNKGGLTITTTGKTCMQSTTDVNIGGDSSTNIGVTCAGGVYSNNVGIYAQTGITETANTVTISGTSSVNASGATINISGSTSANISGGTVNVKSTGSTNITAGDDFCVDATDSARLYGKGSTYVGVNCSGTIGSATTVEGTTLVLSGNTTNISGATTLNLSGKTVNVDGSTINIDSSGNACIEANDTLNLGGVNDVEIGYDCGGNPITKDIRIHADKNINIDSTGFTLDSDLINIIGNTTIDGTTNISGATTIGGATTINNNLTVTGNTYISGDTYIKNTLHLGTGLEKSLYWKYGSVCNSSSGSTNFSSGSTDASRTITIPKTLSDVSCAHVSDTDVSSSTNGCISFTKPLCVTGTVTASGAIYSSDRRLKDNIMNIDEHEINMAKNVRLRSFTLRDDAEQRKTYGVIAQEVLETGLGELVHTREDGMYGVDYTSLLILKVAYLENELKKTNEEFEKVKAINQSNQDKLTELIQNIKKLENKFDDMNNKD